VEVGVGPVATSSGEQFSLEDRYRREAGAVYVTGIQALVRMLLDRARADQRAGGTPWDPFGRTRVRRTERALVGEYRAITGQLLTGLTTANHALAVEIAGLPDLVRGYEVIKLGNVAAYRDAAGELLARFSAGAQSPASA
jgi:hypothetical protein